MALIVISVDDRYLFHGLVAYNYFPFVRKQRDDIAPFFNTESLTVDAAGVIAEHDHQLSGSLKDFRTRSGYDAVRYSATRYTNVSRHMQLPHPAPYCALCAFVRDHWSQLSHICTNPHSQIVPRRFADGRVMVIDDYEVDTGRVVVMDGEAPLREIQRELELSSGHEYLVEADVANCFDSLYSHALPWALMGRPKAKANRDRSLWQNQLDTFSRRLRRNETSGAPIGPATSNLLAEIVLYPVDQALASKGHQFVRFIDDYKCYCSSEDDAKRFLRDLEAELSLYLLRLNEKKVFIHRLPNPARPDWIVALSETAEGHERLSALQGVSIMDKAIALQRRTADGSVIKYATRIVARLLHEEAGPLPLNYMTNVAMYYPAALPVVVELSKRLKIPCAESILLKCLERQITHRRPDAICWTLYQMACQSISVPDELVSRVVQSGDCIAMTALLVLGQGHDEIQEWLKALPDDTHTFDANWILIHETAAIGKLSPHAAAYHESSGLKLLLDRDIRFAFAPTAELQSAEAEWPF